MTILRLEQQRIDQLDALLVWVRNALVNKSYTTEQIINEIESAIGRPPQADEVDYLGMDMMDFGDN